MPKQFIDGQDCRVKVGKGAPVAIPCRPVLNGNINLPAGDRTLEAWINTSVIAPAVKGSIGIDSGRFAFGALNGVRAPRTMQLAVKLYF